MLILISFILVGLTGCNSLILNEYDHIKYNGADYIHNETEVWQPNGAKLNEKISVYLVDYTSHTNYKNVYNAYGFKGDKEHIFLFFNGVLYTKKGYSFPDATNESLIVDRIKLTTSDDNSRSYIFENKDFIDLFMKEFRHRSSETGELKRIPYEGYNISLYVKNYFAFSNGGFIAFSKKGQLGFENDLISDTNDVNEVVELLSPDLNKQILAKLHR
ncbi:hypothetical protein G9F72_007335 [Clostridium estertheticum]|uniref:hypothetical protein n=1 Tax=Clostridium estertheticum TaxID=238834 RepID=UPI001CD11A81|nr:hypothetical protein [Clostridium estertheticum]MBZ9686144.1 hypothetical protein [Clostridium estertheticum]